MEIKKIRITIKTLKEANEEARKFAREWDRGIFKKHDPELSFENYETFQKFLSQKRLELLRTIGIERPRSIKHLSDIVQRDFKNVYNDIKILKKYDLIKLKKTNSGFIPVPVYDKIEIEIPIKARIRAR